MKKFHNLPSSVPVFPLSNFIIFPETTVPLNIFEPRYIQMIDDSMKNHRMIGMVQPYVTKEKKFTKIVQRSGRNIKIFLNQ